MTALDLDAESAFLLVADPRGSTKAAALRTLRGMFGRRDPG